jgi:hypothetical protein
MMAGRKGPAVSAVRRTRGSRGEDTIDLLRRRKGGTLMRLAVIVAVALTLMPRALAAIITPPILSMTGTGSVSYTATPRLVPLGDEVAIALGASAIPGNLAAAAGSVPAGTSVTLNLGFLATLGEFVGQPGPADITNNVITQPLWPFINDASFSIDLTTSINGSRTLLNALPVDGYITGQLGSNQAEIVLGMDNLHSDGFITGLPSRGYLDIIGTTNVPLTADFCPGSNCPLLESFKLDWSLQVTSTSPVPEPSILVFFLAGSGPLLAYKWWTAYKRASKSRMPSYRSILARSWLAMMWPGRAFALANFHKMDWIDSCGSSQRLSKM